MTRQLRSEDYTVGWVCALPVELAAAKAMLDERHDDLNRDVSDNDENIYCLGSVAGHNVAIVCLPAGHIGNSPAATVTSQMRATFKGIRFGLMVGIGGGVPSAEADIRLGDVVVSQPYQTFGGVVQYDLGKTTPNTFKRIGSLNSPPQILLSALNTVKANGFLDESTLSDHISKLERIPSFQRSKAGDDVLFEAAYNHKSGYTCDQCSTNRQQARQQRERGAAVVVHYGTIASGNQVMKSAVERDKVSAELGGVLCFEMEAAGLMNSFPCLVIRGICDYADSHNKRWQAYASGTAAAYAKELLLTIPPADVITSRPTEEATDGLIKRSSQHLPPDCTSSKRRKPDVLNSTENGISKKRAITLPISHQKRSRTSLNDEQKHCLLESLRFEQIDARQMTIKSAHAKTCKWLLKNLHYLNWLNATKLDEHHGFLWIKGKAGAGKSTLMKFAMMNARKMMEDYITLAFFFNARGEDMERSTIGTYRSLLLQLLERLPALQSVFDSLDLPTSSLRTDHRWNVESLKRLLEESIQALGETSVVCFIDALDECEEEQVRDMIQFFERVGDLAVATGIRFQVCFSSRHYPHITIRNGLELVLEGQEGHSQDIANYVDTELKIGKSKTAQQVRVELQEKASGIFMWVVLVVGILNKASDRGQVHTLRRKLHEIPGDLHELFRNILTRDSDNRDELVLCIQWVLFAKQPLNPEQLYYAILSGIDPNAVSQWDSDDITKDVINRFILDSSKGLCEATMSKEQRIQFIHESVRDFLLKENGLGQIWPEFRSNFQGQSHERLKRCCLNYISIDVSTPLGIPDDLPKANKPQAAALRKEAVQKFPFLEYAVQNILYHADVAEGSGIPQAEFLTDFSFPQWVKLDNLFEKHEVRRHTYSVTRLYMLAELNMSNLLRVSSSAEQCMEFENERYGCPLFAAAATGSEKTLELCLRSVSVDRCTENALRAVDERVSQYKQSQRAARRGFVYTKTRGILLCAAELGNDDVLTFLIGLGRFKTESKDSSGRTVLWWASKNGCERAARSLLLAGSTIINSKDKDNKTPLYVAVENGNKAVVELLLDKGADVNAQGGSYGNALQAALANGYKEIVTVLLDKGADVNAQGGQYGNALHAASEGGYKDVVTLLLDRGADVNAQGRLYGNSVNALQAASGRGYKEMVMLLLDRGADVNVQGGQFGNTLQVAVERGYKDVVTLLLDRGANVNAQGGFYGNALQAASVRGYKEIVMLLLDRGADINAQGGEFGNALQAASVRGYKEIVMLLLDRGADINAQGGEFGNALQAASVRGNKEIVMLLLDRGANVNAQGGYYGNALQAASSSGHKEIVTLLLDRGANVNAQGGQFGNALQAASVRGNKEIVMLLLDRGANVNAQGGYYGNALQAASGRGHKDVVTLLLDRGANVNAQGGQFGNALQAALGRGNKEIVMLLRNRGRR